MNLFFLDWELFYQTSVSCLETIKQDLYRLRNVSLQMYKFVFFSLIYFAEKDAVAKWSFMDSFWWGLMVLTTVGYGARAPHTFAGQVAPSRLPIFLQEIFLTFSKEEFLITVLSQQKMLFESLQFHENK